MSWIWVSNEAAGNASVEFDEDDEIVFRMQSLKRGACFLGVCIETLGTVVPLIAPVRFLPRRQLAPIVAVDFPCKCESVRYTAGRDIEQSSFSKSRLFSEPYKLLL